MNHVHAKPSGPAEVVAADRPPATRYRDVLRWVKTAEGDTAEPSVLADEEGKRNKGRSAQHGLRAAWAMFVHRFVPSPVVPSSAAAWALLLTATFAATSYFAYLHSYPGMDAGKILDASIQLRSANLRGQTEHQLLRIEENSADGSTLQQGVVDFWKDGDDARHVRRLYDMQHHLLAAEWRHAVNGFGSAAGSGRREVPAARDSSMGEFWDQELSVQAFPGIADGAPQMHSLKGGGYELTRIGPTPSHPRLVSATLVLDRSLQPLRLLMRVREGNSVHALRFVQTSFERQPSDSVPDTVFTPESQLMSPTNRDRHSNSPNVRNPPGNDNTQMAELEIAVLYQLQLLNADTGIPIEVHRTPQGQVRVWGLVATDVLKQAIDKRLQSLAGHERIDLKIVSSQEVRFPVSRSRQFSPVEAYEVAQPGFTANARIRKTLAGKGVPAEHLDASVAVFSRTALQHAQRALQHAYALDRLGNSVSADELRSLKPGPQQQWSGMVSDHATALEAELRSLHALLAEILPDDQQAAASSREIKSIDDPKRFARVASALLSQVQDVNRQAGAFFASTGKIIEEANLNASTQTMMDTIPLQQAGDVAAFVTKLDRVAKDRAVLGRPR